MKRFLRLDGKGNASALGPLEARVMDEIWRRGGWLSVPDLMPAFEADLAYSTIKTIVTNLAEKGLLKKRAAGKANEFAATTTRDAFDERMVEDVVQPLMQSLRNPLLAHIVGQLNDDDGIAELERLLQAKRASRRRG